MIFVLYVAIALLRQFGFKPKTWGGIVDATTGYPLSFAIIRVYSPTTNVEITHKVADATGRYYCLVANGTYYITIDKKNPDGTYTRVLTTPASQVTTGIINQMFQI